MMSLQANKPKAINLDRESGQLTIQWTEGHVSTYSLDALREACPCAACRGGHEFMGPQFDPNLIELTPARSYQARDLQLVGNYALQFFWSDGHTAGIYTFDYLHRICPCVECQARRASEPRP